MKILDKYILTTFLKTFFSVLAIIVLIFVFQSTWLYITELAGKELDFLTIGEVLMYITITLIPLILPLTILLASIMVFGNFAENYEFAAMKSTGISLQRAMRSLSMFIVGLGIITFFFSNNVIPWAQYNSYNLRKNIAKLKPSMAIAEGQFNDVGTINIKVEEISGDNNENLRDVTIHKKTASGYGNYTTIKSETGKLLGSEDSNILKLILYNGNYYDELQPKDFKEKQRKPFAKSYFEKYTINIDLSQIDAVELTERNITSKYDMLAIKDLNYTIDSLLKKKENSYKEFSTNLYNRSSIKELDKKLKVSKDSIFTGDIIDLFDVKKKARVVDIALSSINSTEQIITSKSRELTRDNKWLNNHIVSLHEKFVLGFACIILFFVGAPLGALIKKGGLGLPLVVAIMLFLTYHFIGLFAKNSALNGSINPVIATWLSTAIIFPLSIYLTRSATLDKPLVSFGFISEPIKKLLKIKDKAETKTVKEYLNETSQEYQTLSNYDEDKLVDVIKNYYQYDYSESYRNSGIKILESRGITENELHMSGRLKNLHFEDAKREMNLYDSNSKTALITYITYLLLAGLGLVLNNNKFEGIAIIISILTIIAIITFYVYLFKSFANLSNFYKKFQDKGAINILAFIIIGMPLYFLIYFYYRKKLKEEIKQIR